MHFFSTFIISLFLTIGLIPIFKRMAFKWHLVDTPDPRKVHATPMARSGGISMALGAIIPIMIWVPMDDLLLSIYMGCAIIVFFGILDDVSPLDAWQKLLAQVAGAAVVILRGGLRIESIEGLAPMGGALPMTVSLALTLVFIVGVTNAINLSDGLDGLAGGISMMSFISIGFFAYRCGNIAIALMSIAVAGSILGFLRFNTHPAVIFMGDAGSQMLGFLSVVFTIVLTQTNTPYSQITPLFLIGFPILDTLMVMVERISKGVSPFKPDKNHFHHKLMKLGLYHSEAVLSIYLVQALFICCAFFFRFYSNGTNLLIFTAVAGGLIFLSELTRKKKIKFRNRKKNKARSRSVLAMVVGEQFSIRFFFRMLKWWLPLVLLIQSLISTRIPDHLAWMLLGSMVLILGVTYFQPGVKKDGIRMVLYCCIPFLMYTSTMSPAPWMTQHLATANHLTFVALIFFVIATLNLTKRKKGFRFNPLDFLIFIVIFIFPNLPSIHIETPLIKVVVSKVLILFFSYDVLLGELRENDQYLEKSIITVFTIIVIRSFI